MADFLGNYCSTNTILLPNNNLQSMPYRTYRVIFFIVKKTDKYTATL